MTLRELVLVHSDEEQTWTWHLICVCAGKWGKQRMAAACFDGGCSAPLALLDTAPCVLHEVPRLRRRHRIRRLKLKCHDLFLFVSLRVI